MFTPGRLWDCCVTQSQLKQEIGLCTNPKAPALADKHSRHSLVGAQDLYDIAQDL